MVRRTLYTLSVSSFLMFTLFDIAAYVCIHYVMLFLFLVLSTCNVHIRSEDDPNKYFFLEDKNFTPFKICTDVSSTNFDVSSPRHSH